MKKIWVLAACMFAFQANAQQINQNSTLEEKVAYSLGYSMGASNTDMFQQLNLEVFIAGFKAALAGQNSILSPEETMRALTEYGQRNDAKAIAELQKMAVENAQQGQAFLAKNAKVAGVKTTKSGLQYQVLKASKGKKPKANSSVTVHYEGRLLDQTIFDSSIAREQAIKFPLNQVILGWTEGLQLMSVGSKYRFFIPAELAYGETGSGDAIPPNSTLIFDVELLEIHK